MSDLFIPPSIQTMADRLEKDTGVRPVVEKYINGLRLVHADEHVRMTIHYKQRGKHNRWQHSGSTLEIDGVPTLLANSYRDYVEVFRRGRKFGLEDCPVVGEPRFEREVDAEEIPKDFRDGVHNVVEDSNRKARKARQQPKPPKIRYYFDRERGLTALMDTPGLWLLFSDEFEGYGKETWSAVDKATGRDVTELLNRNRTGLAEALAGLVDDGDPGNPGTLGHTHATTRMNSVDVRKTTVIRV